MTFHSFPILYAKKEKEEGHSALASLLAVEGNTKIVKHDWAAVRLLCDDNWSCVPECILEIVVGAVDDALIPEVIHEQCILKVQIIPEYGSVWLTRVIDMDHPDLRESTEIA